MPSPAPSGAGPRTPSSRRSRAHQAGDAQADQEQGPDPAHVEVDAARPVEKEKNADDDEQGAGDKGPRVGLTAHYRSSNVVGGEGGEGGFGRTGGNGAGTRARSTSTC